MMNVTDFGTLYLQGSHSDWKSGENGKSEITFSSQGKIREFDNLKKNQEIY